MPDFELVTRQERFNELKPDWDALWLRCRDGGLNQSFDCCLKIWQAIAAPEGRRLLCLIGWQDGRMIAAWPLVTYRKLAWTFARPLEANDSDFSDILIDDAIIQRDWIREAWRVLRRQSGVDVLVLPHFVKAAAISDVIEPHETSSTDYVTVHLKAERDWDSYYTSLSKSHRRDHAKSRRRLAEMGMIGVEVIDAGDPRGPQLVEWMLAQKRLWAEHAHKKGAWLYADTYRDFLTRLVTDRNALPRCQIMSLTLDGTPIAVQIYAAGPTTLQAMISGFDAQYQKYSPGIHLSECLAKWALQHQLDCNLGLGAEQYKRFWSRNSVSRTTTCHLAVSAWGKLALRARSILQKPKPALAEGTPAVQLQPEAKS